MRTFSCMCSFGELEWMGTGKAKIEPLDLTQKMPKMSYKDGYVTYF